MLIAAAVKGKTMDSPVEERYEDSAYLLVIETDSDTIAGCYERKDDEGIYFGNKIIEHDCEAVVCGLMREPGFELVAGNSVTRYLGTGLSACEAVHCAEDNVLPLITDFEGGSGCSSHEN